MAPEGSNAQPCGGEESYIFISYAHRNRDEVLEIIGRMRAEGCRLWYNEGIDPGTERAAHIAEQLADCSYFIAFLSPEYLESDDCLDELNFARDKEKNRLLVYLSNVTLPDGISMRVNRLQAIHKYAYKQEEFYGRLFQAKGLRNCMASSVPVPECASPHVPDSLPESEEKIPAGQRVHDTDEGASSATHFGTAPGKRRKLLLLVPAAVCIFLAVLIPSLAGNSRTDGEAPPDATAISTLIPDSADLGGLSFGMPPDKVREIMTAADATEISAYYTHYGLPAAGYDPGTLKFNGCDVEKLIAFFNSDGLQQLCYYVPHNNETSQTLRGKYGEPTEISTDYDAWDLGGGAILMYYYNVLKGFDGITIALPSESYLDMRGFSWGMSPAEAQKAEAGRFGSLTLTKSDIGSEGNSFQSYEGEWEVHKATEISPLKLTESGVASGYPYQYYEGEWEVGGHPTGWLILSYADDQLIMMQYPLLRGSFEQVVADLDILYGENTRFAAADGDSIAWRIAGYQDNNNTPISIAISATRSEDGVLMTLIDADRYQKLIGNPTDQPSP